MAELSDDPADAAVRLEAALERIARSAREAQTRIPQPPAQAAALPDEGVEIAARLDDLIARLRTALGSRPA